MGQNRTKSTTHIYTQYSSVILKMYKKADGTSKNLNLEMNTIKIN